MRKKNKKPDTQKERHINNKHPKTQTNQTKTKLSLQGPQWSRHSVARVRRRGENSSTLNLKCMYLSGKYGGTRKSSLLSVENGMGVAT